MSSSTEGLQKAQTIVYQRDQPQMLVRAGVLRVVKGPDAGKSATLELAQVAVGTGEECQLRLSDPKVSRRHLVCYINEKGYLVRDLDSTNGTFYRGARLAEAILTIGQELVVGDTVLRLDRGEERSLSITPQVRFGSLVGSAPAMQSVFGLLAAVAPTEVTVLLLGETGTGKELAAKEIHENSRRQGKPFVVVDCGSIPSDLVESELFGHEKGAFTGATAARAGIFEQANGGTVFLDEIGELPLAMQTRLLRVLDQRTVRRVGGTSQKQVDIRVVAATHRHLESRVKEGTFREDLFYRLSVVKVQLPPLRERREDIPLLARHFLKLAGAANPDAVLTPEVLEVLATRKWRGNARELRNVVERAVVLQDGSASAFTEPHSTLRTPATAKAGADVTTTPTDESEWVARTMPVSWLDLAYKDVKTQLLDQFERYYFAHHLELHGSNISRIASAAGVDRQLVRKLLRKHDLIADND